MKNKVILLILIIISFIGSCICVYNRSAFPYDFYFISCGYTIGLFICYLLNIKMSLGIVMVLVTMLFRYVFCPLSIYINNSLSELYVVNRYMNSAVWLMIYEQFAIFLTIIVSQNWFVKSYKKQDIICKNVNNYILVLIFIVWALYTLLFKDLATNFRLIISNSLLDMNNVSEIDVNQSVVLFEIIWKTLYVWLFIVFVNKMVIKYTNHPSIKYVIYSIFITYLMLLVSFIDQARISRWYTIIITLSALVYLIKGFKQYAKVISLMAILPLMI